jgi:hypothetical protein
MKVNEYLPNLDVEAPAWLDALERFYRPWQMAYFRPFSNVIFIKMTRAVRKKYLQHGGRPSMTSSRDVTASPLYLDNPAYTCKTLSLNPFFLDTDRLQSKRKLYYTKKRNKINHCKKGKEKWTEVIQKKGCYSNQPSWPWPLSWPWTLRKRLGF